MSLRKENVFLVTGRSNSAQQEAESQDGPLVQRVVCAADEQALFEFIRSGFPEFAVVGVANLAALEATVVQIKQALSCTRGSFPVFVDPRLGQ